MLHAPNPASNALPVSAEREPPASETRVTGNVQRSGKHETDLRGGFGCQALVFLSSLFLFLYLSLFAAGERCGLNHRITE